MAWMDITIGGETNVMVERWAVLILSCPASGRLLQATGRCLAHTPLCWWEIKLSTLLGGREGCVLVWELFKTWLILKWPNTQVDYIHNSPSYLGWHSQEIFVKQVLLTWNTSSPVELVMGYRMFSWVTGGIWVLFTKDWKLKARW